MGTYRSLLRRNLLLTSEVIVITVFYDDQCGLCSKEIRVYKLADQRGTFKWQGLSDRTLDLKDEDFDLVAALERLHVKDESGSIHVGVDAFIIIWKHLPRWKVLAFIASISPVHWILSIGYRWFAKRRFRQLTHCQAALNDRVKE